MNRDQVRGVQNERNTEMKSLSSAKVTALALAFLVASPTAFAAESLISDRALDGRPISEITATLASRGIIATEIEKWGSDIRVYAQGPDGSGRVLILDKDTLRPLNAPTEVGTNLDVGQTRPAARPASNAYYVPQSLSENTEE